MPIHAHVCLKNADLGVFTVDRSRPGPILLVGVAALDWAELAEGVGVTAK